MEAARLTTALTRLVAVTARACEGGGATVVVARLTTALTRLVAVTARAGDGGGATVVVARLTTALTRLMAVTACACEGGGAIMEPARLTTALRRLMAVTAWAYDGGGAPLMGYHGALVSPAPSVSAVLSRGSRAEHAHSRRRFCPLLMLNVVPFSVSHRLLTALPLHSRGIRQVHR